MKIVSALLKATISCTLILYLIQIVDFRQVWHSLSAIAWPSALLILALYILMQFLNAFQLQIIARRSALSLTFLQIAELNFVSLFYGLLIPGELSGGLIKWYILSKKDKKKSEAFFCIAYLRLANTLILAIFGAAFFYIDDSRGLFKEGIGITMLLVIVVILIFLLFSMPLASSLIDTLLAKKIFLVTPEFFKKQFSKIWESAKVMNLLSSKDLVGIYAMSISYHLIGIAVFYLISQALIINVPLVSLAWIRSAITFLQMLPISISGLGVREGALVYIFKGFGNFASKALAFSLVLMSCMIAMALIGGIIELNRLMTTTKQNGSDSRLQNSLQKAEPQK